MLTPIGEVVETSIESHFRRGNPDWLTNLVPTGEIPDTYFPVNGDFSLERKMGTPARLNWGRARVPILQNGALISRSLLVDCQCRVYEGICSESRQDFRRISTSAETLHEFRY
jgi:hypothetical protein